MLSFRKNPVQPLNALEREFLPPLLEIQETPVPLLGRAVLWVVVITVTVFAGWAAVGELDVVATAPGRVVVAGGTKSLQAEEVSIIRAIHVKVGQHVQLGELLVELDPTEHGAELAGANARAQLLRLELARLQSELEPHANQYRGIVGATPQQVAQQQAILISRKAAHTARLAQAENDARGKHRQVAADRELLAQAELTLRIAREREAAARPYVDRILTGFEYAKLTEAVAAAEIDQAVHQQRMLADTHAAQAASLRAREIQADHQQQILTEIDEKTALLAALHSDADKAQHQVARKELHAPLDGIVQSVEITTVGGVIGATQNLLTIVPDNAQLLVEASLSNEDIVQAKLGQAVDIKVDAFPFHRYGILPGKIVWISPDVDERVARVAQKPSTESATQVEHAPGYRLHVQPAHSFISVDAVPHSLSLGMAVTLDIQLGQRKVYDFLLSPISKGLSNAVTNK